LNQSSEKPSFKVCFPNGSTCAAILRRVEAVRRTGGANTEAKKVVEELHHRWGRYKLNPVNPYQ
jgi:hypothetical protein